MTRAPVAPAAARAVPQTGAMDSDCQAEVPVVIDA